MKFFAGLIVLLYSTALVLGQSNTNDNKNVIQIANLTGLGG